MSEKDVCQAAFAQADITPDYPVLLIGRYRPEPSRGIANRLFTQVLAFQRGEERFCLIAMDHLGLTVPLAAKLRREAAALLETDVSHVMLNFSHTHSAPDPTPGALNGKRYFDFLCGQVASCVRAARERFRPCSVGWGLTSADIGENRRPGGTALDRRLGGLMVADRESGRPMALAVRMAAHPNILPSENLSVSSDFAGAAREKLQEFYGFPVMFLQGASGNIKAAGTNGVGEGGADVFQRDVDALADAVKTLRFELGEVKDLQMCSTELSCVADLPETEAAERIAAGYRTPDTQDWLKACGELRAGGAETQRFQVELQFLKLNEGCLCGVSEELFCELALDAQERTGNELLFLNGYTNGCTGYLPGRTEWRRGGYEVYYSNFSYHKYAGRLMPYRAETADRIVDAVVSQWKRINY